MANPEHLAILKQGVEVWNKWREEDLEVRPNLRGIQLYGEDLSNVNLSAAYLHGAYLMGVNMSGADLRWVQLLNAKLHGASFNGSKLIYANLMGADLSGAKFCGANLEGADIIDADLTKADLREASLRVTNLRRANFTGADLSWAHLAGAILGETIFNKTILNEVDLAGASMGQTTLIDIDLSQAKGLQGVRHYGPSSIGIDTIYKSRGNIPENFLSETGVPEQFITYAKSLVGSSIEYYSVFISHSHQNEGFAKKLWSGFKAKDVRAWYFQKDAK